MCVMYVGMIETRFLKILLNSFHENYSDLFKTTTRYTIHVYYIMSLATSWMIALLTTHKILNKRRIKGLVYQTRSSVIYIGPGLLGF